MAQSGWLLIKTLTDLLSRFAPRLVVQQGGQYSERDLQASNCGIRFCFYAGGKVIGGDEA